MSIHIREEHLAETVEIVYEAFTKAEHYKLQIEIMATAMIHLKNDPGISIEDAFEMAMSDWDL